MRTTEIDHDPSRSLPSWIASARSEINLIWPSPRRPAEAEQEPLESPGGVGPADREGPEAPGGVAADLPEAPRAEASDAPPAAHVRQALERGVAIGMVISSTVDQAPGWAESLAELVTEHPRTFRLYLARQGAHTHLPTAFAADSKSEADAFVALAVSTGELPEAGGGEHLGPCVTVREDPAFARSVREHILAVAAGDATVHLDTPDRVAELLGDGVLYFAYGSNMSGEQLARRAPGAEQIAVGFLPDRELAFNRRGTYRPGGVAGLAEVAGARTYGVVYAITATDLAALDSFEGADAYRRVTRTVVGTDGVRHRCQVYESIPDGEYEPDPEYLNLLIAGARDAGLPPPYIERLETRRR